MVELHVYQNVLIPCTIHVPLNRQLKTTVCCPWLSEQMLCSDHRSQIYGYEQLLQSGCRSLHDLELSELTSTRKYQLQYMYNAWQVPICHTCLIVSTHNHHTCLSVLTTTIQHTDSKNNIPVLEHWGGQSWMKCSLHFEYGYKGALATRRGCVVAIWSHSCCI